MRLGLNERVGAKCSQDGPREPARDAGRPLGVMELGEDKKSRFDFVPSLLYTLLSH